MPIKPGQQLWKQRKNHNGGRPSRKQILEQLTAAQRVRKRLEDGADKAMDCYQALAFSGSDPATTRHYVDKILPNEQVVNAPSFTINFVKFGNNDSGEIPAKAIPVTVLASDGERQEASGSSISSPGWKRRLLSKLPDNPDVSRNGR